MKYYVVLNSLCKLIILVKFRSLTFFNFQFKWKNVSIKILFTHNGVIGVDLSSSFLNFQLQLQLQSLINYIFFHV
jgi:hypothetical protein